MSRSTALTVFQGRAGDHNDLAIPGAMAIADTLSRKTGESWFVVGSPRPALNAGWRQELDGALPELLELQARFEDIFSQNRTSIAATSRCAVSLATLPIVAAHHPDVCIVWFDSHADLNTPDSTLSGYLGGLALSGPAGLWESGLGAGIDPANIVLVGQRDLDPFEYDIMDKFSIPHIKQGAEIGERLRKAIDSRPVYVHLDCDVLNPGIVPTDYVHENGLSLADLHECCEVLAAGKMIGIEIAEFQIAWGEGGEPVLPDPLLDALSPVIEALVCT